VEVYLKTGRGLKSVVRWTEWVGGWTDRGDEGELSLVKNVCKHVNHLALKHPSQKGEKKKNELRGVQN